MTPGLIIWIQEAHGSRRITAEVTKKACSLERRQCTGGAAVDALSSGAFP